MISLTVSERMAVATALGLNEQYLYQCLSGRRKTPADHCPAIERATQARATCEQLRPDVSWSRIADAAWPHPGGRPVIDVARADSAPTEAA